MDTLGESAKLKLAMIQSQKEVINENVEVQLAKAKVQAIIDAGQPWTDPDFPPEDSSIVRYGEPQLSCGEMFKWKRASELYPRDQLAIVKDDVNVNDIYQYKLGDCYFLSALSAVAEEPKRIKDRLLIK